MKYLLLILSIITVFTHSCNSECRQVYQQLTNLHAFDDITISAIMGNIDVQTGGSFSQSQKQYGGGPGYGLFQFDGIKKTQYFKYLSSNKDSKITQIKFMFESIYGNLQDIVGRGNSKVIRQALNSKDINIATTIFCRKWQIPNPQKQHLDRRISSAISFLSMFKSGEL